MNVAVNSDRVTFVSKYGGFRYCIGETYILNVHTNEYDSVVFMQIRIVHCTCGISFPL